MFITVTPLYVCLLVSDLLDNCVRQLLDNNDITSLCYEVIKSLHYGIFMT